MNPIFKSSTLPIQNNQAHDSPGTQNSSIHFSSCYAACESGNLIEVQSYLSQDPSLISQVNCEGQTLMHIAVKKEHLQIVEWLHQQDSTLIDQADKKHLTPLHTAAFNEQIVILKLFIKELKTNTSLILQIAQRNCPKTLAFLLEQGVDPNSSNSSHQTLLHLAAEAGQKTNILCLGIVNK